MFFLYNLYNLINQKSLVTIIVSDRFIMSDLKKRTHSRKKRNIEVESNTTQFQTLEHPMLLQFGIALVLSIVAFIGYRITIKEQTHH